jgi:hypothetical protein
MPYLEWGGGNAAFLAQAEYTMLFGRTTAPDAFLHPMVGLPLAGQLLIFFTLFQPTPSRRLTTIGAALLSVLILLITLAGALSLNGKIVLSTLPFLAAVVWHFRAPAGPATGGEPARDPAPQ